VKPSVGKELEWNLHKALWQYWAMLSVIACIISIPPTRSEPEGVNQLQIKAKVVETRLWKKNKAAERVRRKYRTADEILSDQSEKPASTAQPILDMRGPQAKLITDMEALNAVSEEAEGQNVPMPELQHNLRLLVDLAAADIQRIDGKLRHSKV